MDKAVGLWQEGAAVVVDDCIGFRSTGGVAAGGTMVRKIIITALASILFVIAGAGNASAQTVAVQDPVGDAGNPNDQSLGSEKEQGYFDLVRAEVSKESGAFVMSLRVAAPVPAAPPRPSGESGMFLWAFALDTLPGSIAGYLYGPGQKRPFEYFVLLSWDGTAFRAFVIDRTPLPSGGEAVTTDIPFSFNAARDEIRFVIDPVLIGNPAAFEWLAVNALRKSHFGSSGLQVLDFAPDAGTVTWP